MKRTLALIITAVLILAAAPALGEETDPIVGCWYIAIQATADLPITGFDDYSYSVIVLVLDDEGRVYEHETDYHKGEVDPMGPNQIGIWKKSDDGYTISAVGVGQYPAYLDGDRLYAATIIPNAWYCFRRMENFNFYTEVLSDVGIQMKGW